MTNDHGFPYMHMWLKVSKEFFCYYRCNKWLNGVTSNDLKHILVDVMILYGDLTQESVASKLITFGANGVSFF